MGYLELAAKRKVATIEMLFAIIAAVVLLTYSITACYMALICGAMLVAVSRVIFNRRLV